MSWRRRLRDTLFPARMDAAIDDEIRFHIEQRADELVRGGMTPAAARREAARMFGNRTGLREQTRGRDTVEWIADLIQDLRVSARTLRKSPGFTAVSIATLALGVGAITALFTVVNGVLLRGLPYADPDRLVTVWESNPAFAKGVRFSPGNYLDLREQNRSFSQIGAYAFDRFNFTGRGAPQRITAGLASASLFPTLGIAPALGGGFEPRDDSWSAEPVAVLSYHFWQERFGGDPAAIGASIRLDDQPCRIVGIMPPGVPILPAATEARDGVDLWLALERTRDPETMHWRFSYYIGVIGRLRPGATVAQAQREAGTLIQSIQRRWPDNLGRGALVVPLHEKTVGSARQALTVLMGAVAFVLLIACANLANLNLGRGASRRHEIAVRLALGAGRWRVSRQLVAESLLIAGAGATFGLCLAHWGVMALLRLAPAELPRAQEIHVDGRVLAFTLAASACSAILFGLLPALNATRGHVQDGLRDAGRATSAGPHSVRAGNALVVAEIALAMVLLVGAALTIESFVRVLAVDPGFHADGVVTMRIPLSETRYDSAAQQAEFYRRLLERVRTIPGLESAGLIDGLPFSDGGFDNMFTIDGREPLPGQGLSADIRRVDSGYFRTMRIPVIEGRGLTDADRAGAPEVAVVSRSMAARYWAHQSAIGQRLAVMYGNPNPHPTIVGVMGDVRDTLDGRPQEIIYLAYPQGRKIPDMYVTVRAGSAGAGAVAKQVRAAAAAVDTDQPVYRVHTMDELMAASVATRRFEMLLLGVFAAVAMCLAAVGLYGVLAYAVQVRTREIGIRCALGAGPRQVLTMVLGDASRMAAIGVALGWIGAAVLTRSLAALLFEVKATDPRAYLAVCGLLWLVSMAATWVPAQRALRIPAADALRAQ
jgi:putative ABC transport system permease protein